MCNERGECLLQDDYGEYYKNPDMICKFMLYICIFLQNLIF